MVVSHQTQNSGRKYGGRMFQGEFNHTIDPKGRVIIPAQLRSELEGGFVVTKGLDGCLWLVDSASWKKIQQEIQGMPFALKEARMLSRFMIAGATDGDIDKQGRVFIPPNLREYASLEKNVVLSGVGSRLEIWDKSRYDQITDIEDMSAIAEKLVNFGVSL